MRSLSRGARSATGWNGISWALPRELGRRSVSWPVRVSWDEAFLWAANTHGELEIPTCERRPERSILVSHRCCDPLVEMLARRLDRWYTTYKSADRTGLLLILLGWVGTRADVSCSPSLPP